MIIVVTIHNEMTAPKSNNDVTTPTETLAGLIISNLL